MFPTDMYVIALLPVILVSSILGLHKRDIRFLDISSIVSAIAVILAVGLRVGWSWILLSPTVIVSAIARIVYFRG